MTTAKPDSTWQCHGAASVKTCCFIITLLCGAVRVMAQEAEVPPEVAARLREARQREIELASQKALAAARELSGYSEVQRSFSLEEAILGDVNSMPDSLFIQLSSTKPRTLDAAWWWNPLSGNAPSLAWPDFTAAFADAEHLVAKHPWLAAQRNLEGKRSLELHLLGRGIGINDSDLATYILPLWQHAGMEGKPKYCFLARRGDHSWVEFLFSEEDDRALVRFAVADPVPLSPLDQLNLSWHPAAKAGQSYAQYAVIGADGSVRLQSYVKGE